MASLQTYQSHGIAYFRIVESFRKDGKPAIRVLAHLGRVDDILRRHQQQVDAPVRVSSVSSGAVTALHRLAVELDLAGRINLAAAPTGTVQKRDGLTVGESLVAAMIARCCAPRSKRAFADWVRTTCLPELMGFRAADLTSQHFWDQMNVVPVKQLAVIEQEVVRQVVDTERLQVQALAYDTTNFYTHIASTNLRAKLPARGHNKQGRHDLRQMGLALVVDQSTQLPLAHSLYEGARSDMRTFAEFLKPLGKRLRALSGTPEQLTIVFDAGASSRQNLDGLQHYVTAIRPSQQAAFLAEAAGQLADVQLSNGATVRAYRSRRMMAGQQREVVVVFSPKLQEGQIRGLHQALERSHQELAGMGLNPRLTAEAAKQRLEHIRGRQYVRSLLCYQIETDKGTGPQVRIWSDYQEYQRLTTRYFGLRILVTDRAEWSTAQIIEAYRGQSGVEAAFRDMKDPHMLSTRPQFHWTDQKLHVHAFVCVTAYLLVTLLHRRATLKASFQGSARRLLAELGGMRSCRLIDVTGRKGRPRVRWQSEEVTPEAQLLAEALSAIPVLN